MLNINVFLYLLKQLTSFINPGNVIMFLIDEGICQMKGALWKFPETEDVNDIVPLEKLAEIDTTPFGSDLKNITYHPADESKAVSVVDNNFVLWDFSSNPQV